MPWLPFRTRQDFEYTSTAVRGVIPRKIVDEQLKGQHNGWSDASRITLRNSADMMQTLAAAREGLGVPVLTSVRVLLLCKFTDSVSVSERRSLRDVQREDDAF